MVATRITLDIKIFAGKHLNKISMFHIFAFVCANYDTINYKTDQKIYFRMFSTRFTEIFSIVKNEW